MSDRRMFSKRIVESSRFLKLPDNVQNLYFHLNMRVDDDGFVNNPRMVTRIASAAEADLHQLADRGYILTFDSGVVAITHWRMHNQLRKDRYAPTRYQGELASLTLLPGGIYVPGGGGESPASA